MMEPRYDDDGNEIDGQHPLDLERVVVGRLKPHGRAHAIELSRWSILGRFVCSGRLVWFPRRLRLRGPTWKPPRRVITCERCRRELGLGALAPMFKRPTKKRQLILFDEAEHG